MRQSGWLNRDADDVGTGEAGSPDGATVTRIQLRIDASTQRIEEAVFKVIGSDAAVASASLLTERLHGASLAAARETDALAIVAELQLPVDRANVAGVAVEAAQNAISDWEMKQRSAGRRWPAARRR